MNDENQRRKRIRELAQRAVRYSKIVSLRLKRRFLIIKRVLYVIFTNPITYLLFFLLYLGVLLSGAAQVIGSNSFGSDCGEQGGTEYSMSMEEDVREKVIVGNFTNIGMTKEQAAIVSKIIMQSSKGDPTFGGLEDCDNDCLLNGGHTKGGLLSWKEPDLKRLAIFSKDRGLDWRKSSTQMLFLQQELNDRHNEFKKAGFLDRPTVTSFAKVFGLDVKNANNLQKDAHKLSQNFRGEGENCKPLGDGTRPNQWAPQSGKVGASASLDMSDLVAFAWSYATEPDDQRNSYGRLKGPNTLPELEEAMRLAHSITPDPAGDVTASCDRGVAIAIVGTQTDPKYPYGAVQHQWDYVKSNPSYQQVSCEERQPGDIMIWHYKGDLNGGSHEGSSYYSCYDACHTTLYVGEMEGYPGEMMVESSYMTYEPVKRVWPGCTRPRGYPNTVVEYWRFLGGN